MKVYVAGPYTKGDVALNVRTTSLAGLELIKAGHSPYIPHLSHYLHILDPQPYEVWMRIDFEWVSVCDALVRLAGDSTGADREVALVEAKGIPVFYSVKDLLNVL